MKNIDCNFCWIAQTANYISIISSCFLETFDNTGTNETVSQVSLTFAEEYHRLPNRAHKFHIHICCEVISPLRYHSKNKLIKCSGIGSELYVLLDKRESKPIYRHQWS